MLKYLFSKLFVKSLLLSLLLLLPAVVCAVNTASVDTSVESEIYSFYVNQLNGIELEKRISYPDPVNPPGTKALKITDFALSLGADVLLVATAGHSEPVVQIVNKAAVAAAATSIVDDAVKDLNSGESLASVTAESGAKGAAAATPGVRTVVSGVTLLNMAGATQEELQRLLAEYQSEVQLTSLGAEIQSLLSSIDNSTVAQFKKDEYRQVVSRLVERFVREQLYRDLVVMNASPSIDQTINDISQSLLRAQGFKPGEITSHHAFDSGAMNQWFRDYVLHQMGAAQLKAQISSVVSVVLSPGDVTKNYQFLVDDLTKQATRSLDRYRNDYAEYATGRSYAEYSSLRKAVNVTEMTAQNQHSSAALLNNALNLTPQQGYDYLDYALLSAGVYDDLESVGFWQRQPDDDIRDDSIFSGFHASLYRNQPGEWVIAFEGTKPSKLNDILNDLVQAAKKDGIPVQYYQALDVVKKMLAKHSLDASQVVLTGHSLGGGLAQYVAGMLGMRAMTFNPAGLVSTYKTVSKSPFLPSSRIIQVVGSDQGLFAESTDVVASYGNQLGSVYKVNVDLGLAKRITQSIVPFNLKNVADVHSLDNLVLAMSELAQAHQQNYDPGSRPLEAAVWGASMSKPVQPERTLIAIVDNSGSMSSNDPKNLRRQALEMMLDSLGPGTRLGIVGFEGDSYVLSQVEQLSNFASRARTDMRKTLTKLGAGGGTNIASGLRKANAMALNEKVETTFLLLTDGQDSKWQGESDGLIPSGVRVHTVALSRQADRVGLSRVSADTGGLDELAESADDLFRIIGSLFGEAVGEEVLASETGVIKQGEIKVFDVFVDALMPFLEVRVSWPGSDIDLTLVSPDGRRLTTAMAVASGNGVEAATYDIIRYDNPPAGKWQMEVEGVQVSASGEPFSLRVAGRDGALKTAWRMNVPVPEVGQEFVVTLEDEGTEVKWQKTKVMFWDANGQVTEKEIQIDSLMAQLEGTAGTTVWSLNPDKVGEYRVKLTARGVDTNGNQINRVFDKSFRVAQPGDGMRYKRQIDPFIRRVPGML